MVEAPPPAAAAAPPDPAPADPPPALTDSVLALLRELPGLVSDRVELLSLELQRAGLALGQMVALVLAASVLLATAWLALWVGITAGLVIGLGLHWAVALLLVVVVNLAAAAVALLRTRALAGLLALPATHRHLTLRRSEPAAPDAAATQPADPPHAHTPA